MNPFDFATLLVCFIALGFGFFYGILRMVVFGVLAFICLVLSGLYFQTFGDLLHLYANINLAESHAIAFLSTFLVTFILLTAMGLYTFRSIAGDIQSTTNRVAGIAVSLLNTLIVWGTVAHLFIFITHAVPEADTISVFGGTQSVALVESSQTIKPLAAATAPTVVSIVAPFVFSDIYELFPEQANQ